MGGADRKRLVEALHRSLASGDLENVKRVADSLHEAGGDAVAELSATALSESVTSENRQMALRALEALDTSAVRLVERIRSSGAPPESQRLTPEPSQARVPESLPDPGKRVIFGFLIALAILWPAYSIYRFNNPRPQEPKPEWTDHEVRFESLSACRSAIRQQLRDPDSADFPSFDSRVAEVSYSGRVDIQGYLHANNGLGLKVRVDYSCVVQADRQARTLSVLSAQLLQR